MVLSLVTGLSYYVVATLLPSCTILGYKYKGFLQAKFYNR